MILLSPKTNLLIFFILLKQEYNGFLVVAQNSLVSSVKNNPLFTGFNKLTNLLKTIKLNRFF